MVRDMGNVELFELCETNPKVQCKECLLHRNQGIVYCTCGQPTFSPVAIGRCLNPEQRHQEGDLEVLGTAKLKHRKSTS